MELRCGAALLCWIPPSAVDCTSDRGGMRCEPDAHCVLWWGWDQTRHTRTAHSRPSPRLLTHEAELTNSQPKAQCNPQRHTDTARSLHSPCRGRILRPQSNAPHVPAASDSSPRNIIVTDADSCFVMDALKCACHCRRDTLNQYPCVKAAGESWWDSSSNTCSRPWDSCSSSSSQ